MSAAIRVEAMSKRFGSQLAVDRLSLEVPEGSVFGLLGENGAGKTTTIQTLLGLLAPDEGRVETLGLDPSRRGLEVRRRIGYVPERPALYEWMTVAEIGWFAAGFHLRAPGGADGYEGRYKTIVEGFGLPTDRRLRHLSKGMKSKVALALALAHEPELLILDEPTSGLDVLVRREFLESMVELAGSGKTVVLSSHQIAEVERVASHVVLMHRGRRILCEPIDELKARTFLATLTFSVPDHPSGPPLGLPIELIDADDATRQARWLVHASDPSALAPLRAMANVVDLEVASPNLEEIYIGYMRGRRGEGRRPLSVHVA